MIVRCTHTMRTVTQLFEIGVIPSIEGDGVDEAEFELEDGSTLKYRRGHYGARLMVECGKRYTISLVPDQLDEYATECLLNLRSSE